MLATWPNVNCDRNVIYFVWLYHFEFVEQRLTWAYEVTREVKVIYDITEVSGYVAVEAEEAILDPGSLGVI